MDQAGSVFEPQQQPASRSQQQYEQHPQLPQVHSSDMQLQLQSRQQGNTNSNVINRPNKQNRLQNSMRLLMKQASDFQQHHQQQQKSNAGNIIKPTIVEDSHTKVLGVENNSGSIIVPEMDHHPLKQAGAVFQQQIRGLRQRVKSARSLQQQSSYGCIVTDDSNNTENENEDDMHATRVAIVSPTSNDADDDDNNTLHVAKLTPKKKSQHSPIPSNTVKIDLQRRRSSSSINNPESLPEAIGVWFESCHDLLTGPDMMRLVHSTGSVYYHCASICIRTISLPITLPVHITCMTVNRVTSVIESILIDSVPLLQQSSGQVSEEEHRQRGIFGGILSLPGTLLGITGKVAIALVAPVLGGSSGNGGKQKQQQATGVSSSPEEKEKAVFYAKTPARRASSSDGSPDYLERLRLDYCSNDAAGECHKSMSRRKLFAADEETKTSCVKPIAAFEQSDFLLRVNDWGVSRPTDDCDLYYIDISPSAISKNSQELVNNVLDLFVRGAMSLLQNHPVCQVSVDCDSTLQPSHIIQWNPEGPTKRILREMNQTTSPPINKSDPFKDEVLIWSGRFQQQHEVPNGYGRKHGFFLARGCIPMSPDNFVKLLWDNNRTAEYNNFCLGRFTVHGLSSSSTNTSSDDDRAFLDGSRKTASKVIQSEMRVPFAGITVKATCLMHVRPLTTNDGYIICSRSLDVGPSGIQTSTCILDKRNVGGSQTVTPAKNEILWGVNIIRSIPEYPNGTELTSLSQVGSAVPSFLAQKIGLMGIGDFFKNVRQVAEKQ